MNRAVFLDRDGTINEDVGDFCSPQKFKFIAGAREALKMLQKKYALFIVTNQSGVGKNLFSEKELVKFNNYFKMMLKREGIIIERIYYCPHRKEENCICHKPKPYFLRQAEREYDIDLQSSYVIGDHPHDTEMAQRVGAGAIYVLTGHGEKHRQDLSSRSCFIAQDIHEAALWIMENDTQEGDFQ